MTTTTEQLATLCDFPPADLVAYFDTFRFDDPAFSQVGLLHLSPAVAESVSFRKFHPLASALGLIFLDDANTSNHHCYITRGPLVGSILYLVHDNDSAVFYKSLAEFLGAARAANESGGILDDRYNAEVDPLIPVVAADQRALSGRIGELVEAGSVRNAVAELIVCIPALDLLDLVLLEKLARHDDIYVVEAVANAIVRKPRPDLLPIAAIIAEHGYVQVANAGKRALAAIRQIL